LDGFKSRVVRTIYDEVLCGKGLKEIAKENAEHEAEIDPFKAEIADSKRKLGNLYDAVEEGTLSMGDRQSLTFHSVPSLRMQEGAIIRELDS
jgi:hypothetical protein